MRGGKGKGGEQPQKRCQKGVKKEIKARGIVGGDRGGFSKKKKKQKGGGTSDRESDENKRRHRKSKDGKKEVKIGPSVRR